MSNAATWSSAAMRWAAAPLHRLLGAVGDGRRRWQTLAASAEGVVIVEFALIVPVLFALYVGTAEFCRAMINNQAVTRLARSIADLTSLGDYDDAGKPVSQISSDTMDNVFAASKLVLQPFDASTATMRVSAIGIYMRGTTRTVRICSAAASNIAPRSVGIAPADLVIPESYNTNGMRLIVAEVGMPYKPIMGAAFARLTHIKGDGSYPLSATLVWPTRGGDVETTGAAAEVILPRPGGTGTACPATSN